MSAALLLPQSFCHLNYGRWTVRGLCSEKFSSKQNLNPLGYIVFMLCNFFVNCVHWTHTKWTENIHKTV